MKNTEKDDLMRSEVINSKLGSPAFDWVKEFVFSNELNKEVALAGSNDEMFLIDIEGTILEEVSND